MLRSLIAATAALALVITAAGSASALDLTQRKVEVAGKLNVAAASKIADTLIAFDAAAEAPIYLMITATEGSAQGVMMVADTVRSLVSPVVSVVVTQVHGPGAALAPFGDQVLIYRSAGLVFTEVDYEGVKKPEPPKKAEPPKEGEKAPEVEPPKPEEVLLQAARSAYLERFYGQLAERMLWRSAMLTSKLAEGGFVMTPEEAVRHKIAARVVDRITYTKLPEVKREVKVITTRKTERALPDK